MVGDYIELARRFRRAKEQDERPFEGLFDRSFRGEFGWAEVLALPRVVLLAEAGSGKSAEFRARCAMLVDDGKSAFLASVQDVAQLGLENALPPADRRRLAEWQADDQAPAWFFLDSVDEAKDQGHHFEAAARNLAAVIAGREERAHVLVSSRYTDWDAAGDRAAMEKWLGMPEPTPPPLPSFDQEIRATLNRETRERPKDKKPSVDVLVMAPLDRRQLLKFARAFGVADGEAFLGAVEHGNLWRFATRPLDLDWMLGFWRDHKRLGTLREMIEASLAARLIDPDPLRRRRDPLQGARADSALDRIGAAFVLTGKDTLRVPVSAIDVEASQASLSLEAVLPDWADGDRLLLLGRPVFDPATLGRARLHNDNEGVLRSFLAARWLAQLLKKGCPPQAIKDLLFADLYGYRLVRPNMAETAAWLAGLDARIAEELISRSPFLLTHAGDPGSLPVATRVQVFGAALREVQTIDKQKMWFSDDGLRRFADPALDPHVPGWWAQVGDDIEGKHLLLRLVWIGRQRGGLELVRRIAYDLSADPISQLFALRALFELGNAADRARFAAHVIANGATLDRIIILEALNVLCPTEISIDQFFDLIDLAGVVDDGGHASVRPIDSDMIEGFGTAAQLEAFIGHVLRRAGPLRGEGELKSEFREAFAGLAGAAALRLLAHSNDETPAATTDVLLLLHECRRLTDDEAAYSALGQAIGASPGRRRTSFWWARAALQSHPWVQNPDDLDYRIIEIFGWRVTLGPEDIEWLLVDMAERPTLLERLAALRTAHRIWRDAGGDPDQLARIERAAANEKDLSDQLAIWLTPQPENPTIVKMQADMEARQTENARLNEERDKGWVELIAGLRADPSVFDRLIPQTEEQVDSRLYHLWQFVTWRTHSRDRHAIESLDAVAPIFGPELTARFREALIAFAYARTFAAGDANPSANRRQSSNFDHMALAGMALAAATVPGWVAGLDPERARLAARLARIELNGFPAYLVPLSAAHRDVVRDVLWEDAAAQLDAGSAEVHGMLDKLRYADPALSTMLATSLMAYLEAHPKLDAAMLDKAVSVMVRVSAPDGLAALAARRAGEASDPVVAALYLLLRFAAEGDAAIEGLRAKMAALDGSSQASLCCTLLPPLMGDRFLHGEGLAVAHSVEALEQLLILAFGGVRPSEDMHRPNGEVFSRGSRDQAEEARNAIFNRLLNVPGEAAHAALKRLEVIPGFPILPEWIRVHAIRHAEGDSALPPWQAGDVVVFERDCDRAPGNTADLQLMAWRRLESIAHDLTEGKFQQADTLQLLENENAVQRWVANELEVRRGAAYLVQRETHVADEKEPDITLISPHGPELPIEIKVVDGLTVPELEAALETQLVGQYLRHESSRHGILLLVYQHQRRHGWTMRADEPLAPFEIVLAHLDAMARAIRERAAGGPQPIVVGLDVSRTVSLQAKRDAARPAKPRAKRPRPDDAA